MADFGDVLGKIIKGAKPVAKAAKAAPKVPKPLPPRPTAAPVSGMIGDNGGPSMNGLLDSIDLPAGSRPEYRGAAPDRSLGSYPRYVPARGVSERMQRLGPLATDPNSPIGTIFDRYIEKGKTLGGEDWYNTEELRNWFVESLGEERGNAEWMDYMMKIGATSTGSKVPENMRIASFYRALGPDAARVGQLVKDEGLTPVAAAEKLGIKVPNTPENYAYGHLKQRGHGGNIVNQAAGEWETQVPAGMKGAALTKWLQANPKVKGFFNSLVGNKDNIAADMHFMRMLAMAEGGTDFLNKQAKLNRAQLDELRATYGDAITPYISTRMVNGKEMNEVNLAKAASDGLIKDTSMFKSTPSAWADTPEANEYGAYENMARTVAQRYNMTPAQFQAALWMGAGDITNLADASQGTFMDLFRRALDKRAGERGLTRREMFDDFAINRAPLSVAGAAGAGGLLSMSPDEAAASEIEQYLGGRQR